MPQLHSEAVEDSGYPESRNEERYIMGQPAAKQGDHITAIDTHIIMIPSPGGPVPTPLPHPIGRMHGAG